MSKGLYVGVDGTARKVKTVYVGVDGVARKVKAAYVGVDGVAKKFFPAFTPFTYSFSTYPYNTISISDYCEQVSMYAGYNADGLPCIDMFTWNATTVNGGEPCGRITFNVADSNMVGSDVVVKYTKSFNTDEDGNNLRMYNVVNGTVYHRLSLAGADGENRSFRHTIMNNETSFYIEAVAGASGNVGCDIIITSVTVDGVETLV